MNAVTPCVIVGCGATPTRRHINGHLCAAHAPYVPSPPPGTTLADLRAAAVAARDGEPGPVTPARPAEAAQAAPARPPEPSSPRAAALVARARAAAAAAPARPREDLRDRLEQEPHAYVRADARRTSVNAAAAALPRSGTQRRRVLDAIVAAAANGRHGACDVELSRHLQLGLNSVRPRRLELVEAGLVADTGRTRVHDGREHVVWGPGPDLPSSPG